METINGQTLAEARKLYRQAESSEVQASMYMEMAEALGRLESDYYDADDPLWVEMRDQQVASLTESADEMYADADDLRGRIETEWIDHL